MLPIQYLHADRVRADRGCDTAVSVAPSGSSGATFRRAKRAFDLVLSVMLLPVLVTVAALLLCLNLVLNRGPLVFAQERLGRHCRPFRVYKFRTMRPGPDAFAGALATAERHRITPLGGLLRRTRLDELPQVVNVLRGEMSLIGPRPDMLDHARRHLFSVPGYRARHAVLPGISGLAQVVEGYAETPEAVRRKVEADLRYIAEAGWRLEAWIVWRTLLVVLRARGI
ncbi:MULTISPECIES: sugar transferase [unclassified Rhodosalinus]|uniref:sugar transferase n=1 Tax=unclassified Rhodosalinus TaxID=2630183 RepID=UPI003525DA2B